MRIGILGAMLEEVSAIKELIQVDGETFIARRKFIEGKFKSNDVILTFSRWGKVAAATTATVLINKYHIDSLLFIGVAGAVHSTLNIGDLVIGSGLYQHDMDARPFFAQFQIPLTNNIIFRTNTKEINNATLAANRFINKISSVISRETLTKHCILNPQVHIGIIASGDKFINNPKEHQNLCLSDEGQTTLAVEMEGAAVAQVCNEHAIPYLVVRTISDKADHTAVSDYQSFIQNIASPYLAGFVAEYLEIIK
ncbi:5'-methylthioadenosine/adenosylhomocysteine nucleosidase [Legionella sp. D16C41]|uniref:5'-methylthioadenosine/adenosylhomocysteine nucleosidase n=1 Tax=Legionella sp. D16C41 TaxID=3402688 RepID=UPI003AF53D64